MAAAVYGTLKSPEPRWQLLGAGAELNALVSEFVGAVRRPGRGHLPV